MQRSVLTPVPVLSSEGAGFRLFRVDATPAPQRTIYEGLHNDYCEEFSPLSDYDEKKAGEIAVKRLLAGNRGHYGPLEHAHLVLKMQADHNTIMQLRTHRIASFDVQSMRYTGERILRVANGEIPVQDAFWIRPGGEYRDRGGNKYLWTEEDILQREAICLSGAIDYQAERENGVDAEDARGVLPTCYRQNAVVSMNLRSWLHVLEVRDKPDAQWEIQRLVQMIEGEIASWVPEIFAWWTAHRRHKAILAP